MDLADRILDVVMVATTILAILVIIFVVILLAVKIGNSIWLTEPEVGTGVVVSKEFVPAHTTFILAGKILIPRRVPDAWYVAVAVNGEEAKIAVAHEFFEQVEPGTEVSLLFSYGRVSGWIRVKEIRLSER